MHIRALAMSGRRRTGPRVGIVTIRLMTTEQVVLALCLLWDWGGWDAERLVAT